MSPGQFLVMYAFLMPVLLMATALCTDVSVFYLNWAQLRKAADAAALAGAWYLPQHPDDAVTAAQSYAISNGIKASEIVATTVSSDDTAVTVNLTRTVPYYFGKVTGLMTAAVNVSATAEPQPPACSIQGSQPSNYATSVGGDPLIPIGVSNAIGYAYGDSVTLNLRTVGAGDWDLLALGSAGASVLESNIANGYLGEVSAGDLVTTEPGVAAGPVSKGLTDRINAGMSSDPSGTATVHSSDDPRAVIAPLVNWGSINGKSQVPVTGFVALWVDGITSKGVLTAHFIKQVAGGSRSTSPGNSSCPSDGTLSTPMLID